MTINFTVKKDGKVTAFPKLMFLLLHKDIFNYKNVADMLIEELLLLKYIDFQLSQNGKLVTRLQNYQIKDAKTLTSPNVKIQVHNEHF